MQLKQAASNVLVCSSSLRIHLILAATSRGNWSKKELFLQKKREEHLALRSSTREDEKGRVERMEEELEEIAKLSNDASKKKVVVVDDGIMGRSLKLAKSAKKFVDCRNGNTVEDQGVTCEEACAGECCEGVDSCSGFTGSVAKDGSCDGDFACRDATIDEVSGGSCVGGSACYGAYIDEVSGGSCNGTLACRNAKIGVVSGGSCNGT